MTVLIDPPLWPAHGRVWSHLASDDSLAELHAFAARVGIPERGFEGDHYDVPEDRYRQVVAAGAVPVSGRELLQRLQRSGLRRPKRRGERVLLSRTAARPGHRVDAVLSRLPPLGEVTAVHVVLLRGEDLLLARDAGRYTLPGAPVGPGGAPAEIASTLLASIPLASDPLAGPWPATAARQVGYLRLVPPGGTVGDRVELVLRWPDLPAAGPGAAPRLARDHASAPSRASAPPRVPAPPARAGQGPPTAELSWVPAGRAVALLPAEIAPLALSERHRVRPLRPGPAGQGR